MNLANAHTIAATRPAYTPAKVLILAAGLLACLAGCAVAHAQSAARLQFDYSAPFLPYSTISGFLPANTYYSTRNSGQAPNNVLPVASVTNLPTGALSRTIYARVIYPGPDGTVALNQRANMAGAVRFYRSGVLVGSLPYNTGLLTNLVGTAQCFVQPCLFNEFAVTYGGAAGNEAVRGWNLKSETDPRLLAVASACEVNVHVNGLVPVVVTVDCDKVEFELDTARNFQLGTYPATTLTVFLAVLSQPR